MADECCYDSQPESGIISVHRECTVPSCMEEYKNHCGLTHPVGSGTIAGCNSTTLPHFGVSMGAKDGTCRSRGYYTSGNCVEYEDLCGNMGALSHNVIVDPCATEVVYDYTECDPCLGSSGTSGGVSYYDNAQNDRLDDLEEEDDTYYDLAGNPI